MSPGITLSQSASKHKEAELIRVAMPIIVIIIILFALYKFSDKIFSFVTSPFKAAGEALGIKNTEAQTKAIQQTSNNIAALESDYSTNPFNPQYYKLVAKKYGHAQIFTLLTAKSICRNIYDSIGVIYDTPEQTLAAFQNCKSKTQVSFLAETFASLYGKNLFQFLQDGLDTAAQKIVFGKILNFVNQLPNGGY